MVERRLTALIAVVAVFLILLVAWDAFRPAARPGGRAVAPPETIRYELPVPGESAGRSQGGNAEASPPVVVNPPSGPTYTELLARSETRRRVRASAGMTYLNEMLAESSDSILRRWDNRHSSPVRVWLAPTNAANFRPAFYDAVRRAFGQWASAGIPVRFDLTADSTNAEVVFRWRIQFEIERTGQTDVTWDENGHIRSAVITLATFDPKGRPIEEDDVRVVALHEIGHLIGLDHSNDSTDLMFPTARVRDLSMRDMRTALFLYELTPGSLR